MTQAMALEEIKSEWMEDAIATIRGLANHQPEFTADDLRREMRQAASPYWYGGAFSAAKTLGIIDPVGDQSSNTKSRKYGRLRTWRRKINEGVAA
jgi:hypothetical protein